MRSAWLLLVSLLATVPASAQTSSTGSPPGPEANPPVLSRAPGVANSRLGPEAHVGAIGVASSSNPHDETRAVDLGYGVGAWYQLRPEYGFGARYERLGLGWGQSQRGANNTEVGYSAHALWAMGRWLPYSQWGHSIFVNARVGVSFLRLTARGTRPSPTNDPVGAPFLCSATGSPNLAFGTGLGYQTALNERLNLLAMLDATMLRGSSDLIDGCGVGLGSPVTVSASLGFSYLFDV